MAGGSFVDGLWVFIGEEVDCDVLIGDTYLLFWRGGGICRRGLRLERAAGRLCLIRVRVREGMSTGVYGRAEG